MAEQEIKTQIKEKIIKVLNLEDFKPEDIDNEEPLFGEGLGLDSVDALEIILMLERDYGIKFETAVEAKPYLKNIDTMAELIEEKNGK